MPKVNDYYYKIKTILGILPGWYSWREVCHERREQTIEIFGKVLISERDSLLREKIMDNEYDDWEDDENYYQERDDPEFACMDCLQSDASCECDCCGGPLCHQCAECGANFCKACLNDPNFSERMAERYGEFEK